MKKNFIFSLLAAVLILPSWVSAQTPSLCPNGNTIASNCSVPPTFVQLIVDTQGQNGSSVFAVVSIKGDAQNKNVSYWNLSVGCPAGVVSINEKEVGSGLGETNCKAFTFYGNQMYDRTRTYPMLTQTFKNTGTSDVTVGFKLTAYDNSGNPLGTDAEYISLKGQNSTQSSVFIADIMGANDVYSPGSRIKIDVKGVQSNGDAASSDKGFNVQAYVCKDDDCSNFLPPNPPGSYNGNYNSSTGLWEVIMNAPSDTASTYSVRITLYCSRYTSYCNRSTNQDEKKLKFTVSSLSQVQPTISIVGNPTLKLTYDSAKRESKLVASYNVKIVAGNGSVNLSANPFYFVATDGNGAHDTIAWGPAKINDSEPQIIPAGKTKVFNVQGSFNPKTMFAGVYKASLKGVIGTVNIPSNSTNYAIVVGELSVQVPKNTTNGISILGETSPYISSITTPVDMGQKVTITGVRFKAGDRVEMSTGAGFTLVKGINLIGSTKITFTASDYITKAGSYSLYISDSATGKSNSVQFQLGHTSSQPMVFVESLSTQLNYDSLHKESQLTATAHVRVAAGSVPMKVFSSMVRLPFIDTNSTEDRLNNSTVTVTNGSNLASGMDVYSRRYFILPANTTSSFKITRVVNPQQMFAGAYVASLKNLYYEDPDQAGNTLDLDIPANKSNTMTIVGEKSPYINSITQSVSGGSVIQILGLRLYPATNILLDGIAINPSALMNSAEGSKMYFTVPSTWTAGWHTFEVSNSYGKSNRVGFTVIGDTSTQIPNISDPIDMVAPTISSCSKLHSKITDVTGKSCGSVGFDPIADVNKDGRIDGLDLSLYLSNSTNETWCQQRLGNTTNSCPATQTSISILSPNGGERLAAGTAYGLSWSTTASYSPDQKFAIELLNSNGMAVNNFADNLSMVRTNSLVPAAGTRVIVLGSGGTYYWTPARSLQSGNYKLRVMLCPSGSASACLSSNTSSLVSDVSDSYFSITSPAQTNPVVPPQTPACLVGSGPLLPGQLRCTAPVTVTDTPVITITANPASVAYGGSTQVSWSVTNATSCSKTGGWSQQNIPLSGTQRIGGYTRTTTYTINCTNSSGVITSNSMTVTVGASPAGASVYSALVNQTGTASGSVAQSSLCLALSNDIQYRDNDALNAGTISKLQSFLQSRGYMDSLPSGYFGNQTFQAVRLFQAGNNIEDSGYVGALTRAKIQEVSCR